MNIGERIRSLREAKGFSQGDIEKRSGLLRSYISRVEGGYTAPSLATIDKFAKALGVQPYQMLLNDGAKRRPTSSREDRAVSRSANRLLRTYQGLSASNRRLLISIALQLGKKQLQGT